MLRPWVPLIALGLLWALAYAFPGPTAALGGALLALALLSELGARFAPLREAWARLAARRRKAQALKKAAKLDWTIIDNSVSGRPRRDCERPETLGVCTGPECLVYKTCDFNIKKPVPRY